MGTDATVSLGSALPAPEGEQRSAATAKRRLAAGAVDALVLGGGLVVVSAFGFSSDTLAGWGVLAWALGFAPLYFVLYHAFDEGATPGQLELRVALADVRTGRAPSIRRALARAALGLLFLVTVVPALIDVLVLLRTRRSVRDRLTRTAVVRVILEGAVPELREPTVPELAGLFEPPAETRRYLGRGWALVRARPRALVGTVVAVFGALLTIVVVLGFLIVADAPGDEWGWLYYATLATALLGSGVYWTQAAVLLAVEQVRTGARDRFGVRALKRATHRLNALSAALVLLLLGGSLVFYTSWLLLPLLLVGRFAFVAPALVLENRRVLGSFLRSWQLTRGAMWRLLGFVLLSGAILLVLVSAQLATIAGIASVAPDGASSGALVALLVAVAAAVSVPLVVVLAWLGAAWSLAYEDARRVAPPREEAPCSR